MKIPYKSVALTYTQSRFGFSDMKKLLVVCVLMFLLPSFLMAQTITTIAGGGGPSLGDGGPATLASVTNPGGGVFDGEGNYYFLQSIFNPRLRMIDNGGLIRTIGGTGIVGYSGDGGPATSATFRPQGLALDTFGNIYVADYYNNRIRKIDRSTGIVNTIGGTGTAGISGDGGSALLADMTPGAVCVSRTGYIYIVDGGGYYIRKINSAGIVSTVAGTGVGGYGGDGGPATDAQLATNNSICLDNHGNLYLACAQKVRKIDLSTGLISTFAGNGSLPYVGDGMPAINAQFDAFQIGFDTVNSALYIADNAYDRVYQVDAAGIFHLIAGNGTSGFSGDGGPATAAQLHDPEGVATDICGNLYIAVNNNNRIRKVQFSSADMPMVSISVSPNDTNCLGVAATFTSSTVGMTSVSYKWHVNGTTVPTATSATFVYTPIDGDSVYCTATGLTLCNGASVARYSRGIRMYTKPLTPPTIALTSLPATSAAIGSTVTVNAAVASAGSSYSIRWYKNSVPFGITSVPVTTYVKAAGIDIITAKVSSMDPTGCYDTTTSAGITINTLPGGVGNVHEEIGMASATVFPNPASHELHIQGPATNYKIVSMVGQVLQEGVITEGVVSLSGIAPGMYILEATSGEGLKSKCRFIRE